MGFIFDKINMLVLTVFLVVGICFDSQMLFPKEYYHDSLIEFRKSYQNYFKDPIYVNNAPQWIKASMVISLCTGVPYYLMAIFAFAKGNCACIRTPSIMYATQFLTFFILLLNHLWRVPMEGPGIHPETPEEFYRLFGLYMAFFVYHLLFLIYFLRNPNYGSAPVVTTSQARKAKKN